MIDVLYEALRTPFGIIVRSNDPHRLRAKLYGHRKEDNSLLCLSFTISPTSPQELWILKRPENGANNTTAEAHS